MPTNGHLERTVIDWIPGMPPIKLGDMSSFVRTTDPDDFGLRFNEEEANNCTKANALILNTFDELEADVLAALRAEYARIYTIGPLGTLLTPAADPFGGGLSLWMLDTEFLAWLDTQQPRSAVYVNFGSYGDDAGAARRVRVGNRGDRLPVLICCQGKPRARWPKRATAGVRRGDGRPAVLGDMVLAGAGVAPPRRGVLPDAQRVYLLGRERGRRRAEGGLAGVRRPVHHRKYACESWDVGLRLDEEVRREQVTAQVKQVMEHERSLNILLFLSQNITTFDYKFRHELFRFVTKVCYILDGCIT